MSKKLCHATVPLINEYENRGSTYLSENCAKTRHKIDEVRQRTVL